MRHRYKSEEDEITIVDFHVEVDFRNEEVRWSFHPRLPKGMHWKKGDESGLGSDHSDGRQSFDAFRAEPLRKISGELYRKLIAEIDGA